jgi:hypothetical protein
MCLRLLKTIGGNFPKYNSRKKNKLDACSSSHKRGMCVGALA